VLKTPASSPLARAIFENECDSAGRAHTRDGGWRKGEPHGSGYLREFPIQMCFDGVVFFVGCLALVPFFQRDEKERTVGVVHTAQHAVTNDGDIILHTRSLLQDFLRLPYHVIGSLERSCIGQLQSGVHIALILVWQEAARNALAHDTGQDNRAYQ